MHSSHNVSISTSTFMATMPRGSSVKGVVVVGWVGSVVSGGAVIALASTVGGVDTTGWAGNDVVEAGAVVGGVRSDSSGNEPQLVSTIAISTTAPARPTMFRVSLPGAQALDNGDSRFGLTVGAGHAATARCVWGGGTRS